jgi:hypothetical protein
MVNPEEIWQCQTNNCGYMYDPDKGDGKGKSQKESSLKTFLKPGGALSAAARRNAFGQL